MKLGNFKHFTAEDRSFLFQAIVNNLTRKQIAKKLHKSPSAITYELKQNRILKINYKFRNTCGLQDSCKIQHLCNNCESGFCKFCSFKKCNIFCNYYEKEPNCQRTKRFPMVCNGCKKFFNCRMNKWLYSPTDAHQNTEKRLIDSRSHIQFKKSEIMLIDKFAFPLIKKGIGADLIIDKLNKTENLPHMSLSTFYRYIDDEIFSFKNIDLKRKVRYRMRKKSKKALSLLAKANKIGRYYEDFLAQITNNPETIVWELDTVEGRKGESLVMTLLERRSNFMLIFKIRNSEPNEILRIFDKIKRYLGAQLFKETFQTILTDNGKEFVKPELIEIDPDTGEKLINVFFCKPRHSEQKGKIEKNHEHFREIIPKGVSMNPYSQYDMNKISRNINSYPRRKLNMNCPYDVANLLFNKKVLLLNRLSNKLDLDQINLKHDLIKKN